MNPIEKLHYWENQPDMIEVAQLNSGRPFGEIALVENKPRMATIQCITDCTFATMNREDFQKTLKKIETRNTNKIIDFFKNLPYFSSYSRKALGRLRLNFSLIKFKRTHIVFKEGDMSDYVYIIVNGDFELEKKVKHVSNKEMNYYRYISSNIFGKTKMSDAMAKSEVDSKIAKFTKNKTLANSSEYNQNHRIALLSRGQMFGDQDAFHERPYQVSVICRSNDGEVYRISRENFQKLQNHGDCWQKITSKYITQEHLHYRLLKNQEKFNSILEKNKNKSSSKKNTRERMSLGRSPLLNKNEIEKRHIFTEIVNDFPYADRQMKFVETMYKDTNMITDADVSAYQKRRKKPVAQGNHSTRRYIAPDKIIDDFKNVNLTQIPVNALNPKMTKTSISSKKNQISNSESKNTVYISSRISRCIENLIENKLGGNISHHNSDKKIKISAENSPMSKAYKTVFSRQSKRQLHTNNYSLESRKQTQNRDLNHSRVQSSSAGFNSHNTFMSNKVINSPISRRS